MGNFTQIAAGIGLTFLLGAGCASADKARIAVDEPASARGEYRAYAVADRPASAAQLAIQEAGRYCQARSQAPVFQSRGQQKAGVLARNGEMPIPASALHSPFPENGAVDVQRLTPLDHVLHDGQSRVMVNFRCG